MAKDFEIDELLGITTRALFSRSPQWETRRNNFMSGSNPANWFGPDAGPFFGGSIRAGVIAGPKGVWVQVSGGIGPMASTGQNGTWFEQLGHGNGAHPPSQNNVIWTMTWPPNPSGDPFWVTGIPKLQETTTFPWFTKPSSTWPNWATVNPTRFDFGITSKPPQWSTNKPFWLQNSTINPSWFFSTTTKPPWFIAPKGAGSVPLTEGPKTGADWDTFTKKIPPWREANTTTLKPVPNSTLATKL